MNRSDIVNAVDAHIDFFQARWNDFCRWTEEAAEELAGYQVNHPHESRSEQWIRWGAKIRPLCQPYGIYLKLLARPVMFYAPPHVVNPVAYLFPFPDNMYLWKNPRQPEAHEQLLVDSVLLAVAHDTDPSITSAEPHVYERGTYDGKRFLCDKFQEQIGQRLREPDADGRLLRAWNRVQDHLAAVDNQAPQLERGAEERDVRTRDAIVRAVHEHLDFFRPQWAKFCTWADECADQWHRYEEEQNGKYLRASGELESKLEDAGKPDTEDAGKPDTAESKEIQKALDEVKDEWKKSRKLYQSDRRGDLPKAGWRYARCPEWFRHRGLTFYVPDDLDDFTDLFLMIDGPAAKLSDEKQLVRHCALLAVAHDTCLALAPGEPRICDWQAYGQSHFDFEGFMAAVKRSLRERLPGSRYRRDEELCRAYDRVKPHLPDAKTTNPPAGLMIGPDHKPVDPVKSYTRHAPLNAAMNDLAPKLCEVAAGVNADPPARAGGSENAGQKPEAPVTLREFMREYCEPLGNALLESRLTSLQSLWRRKKDIAPEHVTPWRPGQSKKYKPSTLIGIWPTCKEESTGLPDLEKTSE